jgi:tryptophan-rich sensory protein
MTVLASRGQLRASFLRWALLIVPAVVLLGFASGMLAQSGPGNAWFDALVKPPLYPPPATFGIVWSVLYVLMGIALTLVVAARGAGGRGLAIGVFLVQLALNLGWSPLFFAAHRISGALILLGALDITVIATVVLFWRVRTLAGALLLPYLAWVVFATLLNFQFLQANPGADGRAGGSNAAARFEI